MAKPAKPPYITRSKPPESPPSSIVNTEVWRPFIAEQLAAGEADVHGFAAISPNPDPGSALMPGGAEPLFWLADRFSERRRNRAVRERSGFPLARRMVLAVTSERLLVWSANRRWSRLSFLGAIPRDQILRAEAPTVGQGWRSVHIQIGGAEPVIVKVAGKNADELAALLSARRHIE